MIERKQLYIGGRWVAPSSTKTLEVTDSNTGEAWATIPEATEADADALVASYDPASATSPPAADCRAVARPIAEAVAALNRP